MEIYLGNELGNLTAQDCTAIKEMTDGKSYYQFKVSWSNYAGNCQLIVSTDYPNAREDEVRSMFLSVLASVASQTKRTKDRLEAYVKSKFQNPKAVVAFKDGPSCSFIFEDAVRVANILSVKTNTSVEGYPFLHLFQYDSLDYAIENLTEDGFEVVYIK